MDESLVAGQVWIAEETEIDVGLDPPEGLGGDVGADGDAPNRPGDLDELEDDGIEKGLSVLQGINVSNGGLGTWSSRATYWLGVKSNGLLRVDVVDVVLGCVREAILEVRDAVVRIRRACSGITRAGAGIRGGLRGGISHCGGALWRSGADGEGMDLGDAGAC